MNSLNRTVLATLIGAALAGGLAVPQAAFARPGQEQTAQEREDAREARKKEHEAAVAARAEAAKAAAAQPRAQAERGQAERNQPQVQARAQQPREQGRQREEAGQQREAQRDRELSDLRQQQERVREQNERTRQRNEQASQRETREQARGLEREQAREQAERQRGPGERDRVAEREQRQDRRDEQTEARASQQQNRQERQQDRQDARHADLPPPRRIENRERDQRIVREKRQAQVYQQAIKTQVAPQAKAYAASLQHQHRSHGYSYQQQYYWRLLQMFSAWNWQSYNYYNDPYYYTANDYRYNRGGSWYGINRYGADILRQAINYGYQEGLYAGRADRMDGWRYDYRNAWVYRDANYGYRGFYVQQREYNYYFREGFRRGYDDGYRTRYSYGRSYNGSDVILGSVLSGILNLQAYRW